MRFWPWLVSAIQCCYQISFFKGPPVPFLLLRSFPLFECLCLMEGQFPGLAISQPFAKDPHSFITVSKTEGLVWTYYLSLHNILVYLDFFSIEIPLVL